MELEPISDSRQWGWGSTPWGAVSTRENSVFPVCLIFRYMVNGPWTGNGTLLSPGGVGSIIYEPQPIRDRPVCGIGDFHTVWGGINPGDISVFVSGLSEFYIFEWIMILGMDPIVPR